MAMTLGFNPNCPSLIISIGCMAALDIGLAVAALTPWFIRNTGT
jgi:hypothetical protein